VEIGVIRGKQIFRNLKKNLFNPLICGKKNKKQEL